MRGLTWTLARFDVAGWLHRLLRAGICNESLPRGVLLSIFLFLLLLILLLLSINVVIIINIIVILIECNKSWKHHTHVCKCTLLPLLFGNNAAPTHLVTTNQSLHLSCQVHFPFALAPTMLVPPRLPNSAVSAALCTCSRPTCKCSACHSPLPCSHEHRTPAPPARPCTGQHFPAKTTRYSLHGVTTSSNTELPLRLIARPSPCTIITCQRAGATTDLNRAAPEQGTSCAPLKWL